MGQYYDDTGKIDVLLSVIIVQPITVCFLSLRSLTPDYEESGVVSKGVHLVRLTYIPSYSSALANFLWLILVFFPLPYKWREYVCV